DIYNAVDRLIDDLNVVNPTINTNLHYGQGEFQTARQTGRTIAIDSLKTPKTITIQLDYEIRKFSSELKDQESVDLFRQFIGGGKHTNIQKKDLVDESGHSQGVELTVHGFTISGQIQLSADAVNSGFNLTMSSFLRNDSGKTFFKPGEVGSTWLNQLGSYIAGEVNSPFVAPGQVELTEEQRQAIKQRLAQQQEELKKLDEEIAREQEEAEKAAKAGSKLEHAKDLALEMREKVAEKMKQKFKLKNS
uniref:hypothetical protein n=1 Tax=Sedimenticola sp. TaxID=1940285 RepID=UPI003D14A1D0